MKIFSKLLWLKIFTLLLRKFEYMGNMQAMLEKIKSFFIPLLDKENWQAFGENILANTSFKWFVAFCALFLLLRHYKRRCSNCIRIYTTDRGPIHMKKSALKNLVKKICNGVIPQSKSRVKICVHWRRIHLRVSVACPHNMQSIGVQLQQEISSILKQEIGIKNLGSIRVVIEKIIGPIKTKAIHNDWLCAAQTSPLSGGSSCTRNNDFSKNIPGDGGEKK
jgi:hypothetical protein